MAGGESSDFHIVPTRHSDIFRLRVWLGSPEDGPPDRCLQTSTVVAGCACHALYWPEHTSTSVAVALNISDCPSLKGAAKVSTNMVLLDKTGSPAPSVGAGDSMDISAGGFVEGGYVLSAQRDDVKANCVVDDYFVVLCSVDIDYHLGSACLVPLCPPPASSMDLSKKIVSAMENQLSDLGHDLAMMWGKQELTDVSFDVGGESLSAHRLVLAARSEVFRAELYGPMAESKMTSITIQDMEAPTFRSMLYYIYHSSLPDAGKTVAEYQHLLVAADRYGLEGLKKICEDKLCANGIMVDTVVSLLELAEDHVCSKLKSRCFDFLAAGDNFKVVATSGKYLHLMQSFPSLLVDARDRFKIPREKPTIMEPGSHKKTRVG